jgi:hypothetical protein
MINKDNLNPDDVLDALLAKGNRSDKNEKLRKLHELCKLEFNRTENLRDLSMANMSRIAESNGLFKARTIYNAQSADYATLIKFWEGHSGPVKVQILRKQTASTDKYAFLQNIEDPAIRSLCQIALIERDKLRTELNLLKAKFEVIVDMRPPGTQLKALNSLTVIETFAQLTDSERNALMTAIDSKTLAKRHWRIGETGEVIDDRNRFVFMPGFATGIEKVLGKANLKAPTR